MRSVIHDIPNGSFTAERLIDHDGIEKEKMIKVNVTLEIEDEKITFDFTGSDPQAKGYIK